MNPEHKKVRDAISNMTVRQAQKYLRGNLVHPEYDVVYLHDVLNWDLSRIAEKTSYSESSIKRLRRSAYEKLAAVMPAE